MTLDAVSLPGVAPVVTGLVAHAYCKRHEPTTFGGILSLLFGVPVVLGWLLCRWDPQDNLTQSIPFTIILYLVSLSASVIAYRLSPFHPLAQYPGPIACRITRLWTVYQILGTKKHIHYHQLHERYGDVVRTGPNHLHIRNVKAIPAIFGPGPVEHRWIRGGMYSSFKLEAASGSLLSVPPAEHTHRRRIWEKAFTPTALKDYEHMLQKRVEKLVKYLHELKGRPFDLSTPLYYFAVDFMGDMAFGGAFNFLEHGDVNHLQHTTENGSWAQEIFGAIPWSMALLRALPYPPALEKLFTVSREHLLNRKGAGSTRKDLFFYLLGEDGSVGHEPLPLPDLIMESMLALIAGSDSTATTLSNAVYYLLTNTGALARLRQEIDEAVPRDIEYPDAAFLAKLPYLQAVINETLRLQPVIPSGLPREAPPTDVPLIVGDFVVPPNTTVQVPTWSLQRDPRCFWPNPEAFWPDRWLADAKSISSKDFRLDLTAWTPFSYGPTSCVGKQLAMNEMRLVLATLVRVFDISPAPGWDLRQWELDLKDTFVLRKGKLSVVITPRAN